LHAILSISPNAWRDSRVDEGPKGNATHFAEALQICSHMARRTALFAPPSFSSRRSLLLLTTIRRDDRGHPMGWSRSSPGIITMIHRDHGEHPWG